jgi:hypothetical protein
VTSSRFTAPFPQVSVKLSLHLIEPDDRSLPLPPGGTAPKPRRVDPEEPSRLQRCCDAGGLIDDSAPVQ